MPEAKGPRRISRRGLLLGIGGVGLAGGTLAFTALRTDKDGEPSYLPPNTSVDKRNTSAPADHPLASKFEYLRTNGNSSCSNAFRDSISSMPKDGRLQGSCCSPMSWHRYSEQVAGLAKYADVAEVPSDPYDLEAGLAARLMSYNDMPLSPREQEAYDYAMEHSSEKGPCCCKCWRWHVYGGLGRYVIRTHGYTGEQVTKVWNLSDGCGGDSEHQHA